MSEQADELAGLLAEAWARNRERVLGRFAVVEAALAARAAGRDPDAEAARAAHVLAGTLGTYRRAGSDLLRTVELVLTGRSQADPAALLAQVQQVREELD